MVCVLKICEQQLLFMGPFPGSPGATIDIVSSDVAVVEMDSGATSSVSVCVELNDTDDGLLRDVVLLLNTVDETATGTQYNIVSRVRNTLCNYVHLVLCIYVNRLPYLATTLVQVYKACLDLHFLAQLSSKVRTNPVFIFYRWLRL